MHTLRTLFLLHTGERLCRQRDPLWGRSSAVLLLRWLLTAVYAVSLLTLVRSLAGDVSSGLIALKPWSAVLLFLIPDFWLRFLFQQSPVLRTGACALMSVPRSLLVHHFLLQSVFAPYNLFWLLCFFWPLGLLCVVPVLSWTGLALWIVLSACLVSCSALFYQMMRLLSGCRFRWVFAVAGVHVVLLFAAVLWGEGFDAVPALPLWLVAAAFAAVAVVYAIVFRVLYNFREEPSSRREHSSAESFLAHIPLLSLEWLLRWRNRRVRTSQLSILCLMAMLCLAQFGEADADGVMTSFTCLYCFAVPVMLMLVDVMSHEGNYVEALLMERGSVERLLRAKYLFNVLFLLLPLLMLMPAVTQGRVHLLQCLAYMLFTAGVIFPLLFLRAPYNASARALHRQRRVRASLSYAHGFIATLVLSLPIAMERGARWLLGDVWGCAALMLLGVAGVASHRLWLGYVARRFMLRRHALAEGFRATRQL
ncbi:MAG: hypothetical protein J6035_01475 [Bacteroidaceae bacterium]|nr:hypothetical protein [Bacteroidaceae bacterium]